MITLFNDNIALDDIEMFSGNEATMMGVVRLKAATVADVSKGDRIFYPKTKSRTMRYNHKQYVLIKFSDIDGKL